MRDSAAGHGAGCLPGSAVAVQLHMELIVGCVGGGCSCLRLFLRWSWSSTCTPTGSVPSSVIVGTGACGHETEVGFR
jgi:hypothetical protein